MFSGGIDKGQYHEKDCFEAFQCFPQNKNFETDMM